MKFIVKKKPAGELSFQFNFEKTYLDDINSWAAPLVHPDILAWQFKYNEFDGQMAHAVFSQLGTVLLHTHLVRIGELCGHNCGGIDKRVPEQTYQDVAWDTDESGRLKYAAKLSSTETCDVTGKLTKVLKSEIELLQKLTKSRQTLMEGYQKYIRHMRKVFVDESKKDLQKESDRLLSKVEKYRLLLQEEMNTRSKLLAKLCCPFKILKKEHKSLLAKLMYGLRQFVVAILGRGEIAYDGNGNKVSGGYKKCKVCRPDDPNKENLLIFTEVSAPDLGSGDKQ